MALARERVASMVAGVFARLGADAVVSGVDGAVKAVLRTVDLDAPGGLFPMQAQQTGRVIDLLVSEVPARPAAGATVEILEGGSAQAGVYTVTEDAQAADRYRLVWRCPVGEAA